MNRLCLYVLTIFGCSFYGNMCILPDIHKSSVVYWFKYNKLQGRYTKKFRSRPRFIFILCLHRHCSILRN